MGVDPWYRLIETQSMVPVVTRPDLGIKNDSTISKILENSRFSKTANTGQFAPIFMMPFNELKSVFEWIY